MILSFCSQLDLLELLQTVHSYCEHAHRTRANLLDVHLALEDKGISVADLRDHWLKWKDIGMMR
jgi:hypothetical protein